MNHEPKIITKKIWPEYFQAIVNNKKTFEIRLSDFECKEGDTLVLQEWDPKTKKFTGREIQKIVTYVAKTKNLPFWKREEIEKYGLQIIGFK